MADPAAAEALSSSSSVSITSTDNYLMYYTGTLKIQISGFIFVRLPSNML